MPSFIKSAEALSILFASCVIFLGSFFRGTYNQKEWWPTYSKYLKYFLFALTCIGSVIPLLSYEVASSMEPLSALNFEDMTPCIPGAALQCFSVYVFYILLKIFRTRKRVTTYDEKFMNFFTLFVVSLLLACNFVTKWTRINVKMLPIANIGILTLGTLWFLFVQETLGENGNISMKTRRGVFEDKEKALDAFTVQCLLKFNALLFVPVVDSVVTRWNTDHEGELYRCELGLAAAYNIYLLIGTFLLVCLEHFDPEANALHHITHANCLFCLLAFLSEWTHFQEELQKAPSVCEGGAVKWFWQMFVSDAIQTDKVLRPFLEFAQRWFFLVQLYQTFGLRIASEVNWTESGFQDTVSISLNKLSHERDRKLFKIRTVKDEKLHKVFPNPFVVSQVIQRAKYDIVDGDDKASTDDDDISKAPWEPGSLSEKDNTGPFICIGSWHESTWLLIKSRLFSNEWWLSRSAREFERSVSSQKEAEATRIIDQLKNQISSIYGDKSGGINECKFIFGITFEKNKTSKMNRKFRVLLMKEDELEDLNSLTDDDYELKIDYAKDRKRNLCLMKHLYEERRKYPKGKENVEKEDHKFPIVGDIFLPEINQNGKNVPTIEEGDDTRYRSQRCLASENRPESTQGFNFQRSSPRVGRHKAIQSSPVGTEPSNRPAKRKLVDKGSSKKKKK